MERDSFESLLDEAPVLQEPTTRGELFLPASHMRLLEKLEHLSRYSHFVQVVVGLPGSGKSTLIKQFLPSADDSDIQACLVSAKDGLTVAALLRQLGEQLHLEQAAAGGNAELFKALVARARELAQIPRLFLIVVDDADELSDAALALLFKLQEQFADPDARPHLVMFGGPRLKDQLKAEVFKEVMAQSAHVMELEPLSFDEMQGFVVHRFGADAEALGERELKQLYNDTFGLPGRIPAVLEQMLEQELAEKPPASERSAGSLPVRLLLIGVVLMLPMVGGWFWLTQQAGSSGERLRVELPAPALAERPVVPEPEVVEETLEQRLEKVRQALEQERIAQALAERAEAPSAAAASNVTDEPTAVAAQLPLAPVKMESVPDAPPKRVLTLPPPDATPEGEAAVAAVSPPASTPILAAPAAKSLAPQTHELLRERELLAWDPAGYTLQVLGARRESSVAGFIRQQRNPEQFFYFSTLFKDKPWFVVVYGNYPDRAAAIAAIADLPVELRKRRPWARSIEGVHKDIRRKE
ncbi:AAA family ATPase [Motiliproteus sediminis]|uniref:AAA family ATPase n=1 Tax=Motiliproteus sediminis TaxID=1468178 RepID=UPI001AEFB4EB|nr:AAA family ATPase [Motiliproteus sediminis]